MYNIPIPPIEIKIGDVVKKLVNDTDAYAYFNNVANNSPSASRWSSGYQFDEKVPASEWNWTFGQMTRLMFRMRKDLYSSCNEMMNFIKDKIPDAIFTDTDDINPELDGTNHQLKDAIDRAIFVDRTIIAGTQIDDPDTHQSPRGSVTTSNANGKVSVDPDTGVMTANGLGDVASISSFVNKNNATTIAAIMSNILNVIYPVGCYYWSSVSTDPSLLFGGTWVRVSGVMLYAAEDNVTGYTAGSTGGAKTHALTAAQLPAHYHERGSQEITGNFTARGLTDGSPGISANGAFFAQSNIFNKGKVDCQMDDDNPPGTFGFAASRSWSGRSDGGHTLQSGGSAISGAAHNNMPPYLAAYCWRRTA